MTLKIGINGLGRIGRMVIRAIFENNNNKNIEIKHINNRSNSEISGKLLKHDSIHGKFNSEIKFDNKSITIGKQKISFSQETNIENINWKKYIGKNGISFGLNDFGKSAIYKNIYKNFKLTADDIVKLTREMIIKNKNLKK